MDLLEGHTLRAELPCRVGRARTCVRSLGPEEAEELDHYPGSDGTGHRPGLPQNALRRGVGVPQRGLLPVAVEAVPGRA